MTKLREWEVGVDGEGEGEDGDCRGVRKEDRTFRLGGLRGFPRIQSD